MLNVFLVAFYLWLGSPCCPGLETDYRHTATPTPQFVCLYLCECWEIQLRSGAPRSEQSPRKTGFPTYPLSTVPVWPCSVTPSLHPSLFLCRYDFYLTSQTANRGTVSPTYYNVIYDDNALKPDHMQRLTFKLCHLYYNWQVRESLLLK